MGLVFDTIRRVNTSVSAGDTINAAPLAAAVRSMLDAVGLVPRAGDVVPDDVVARAAELDAARAAKDFATADAIRAELQSKGFVVETSKSGTTVRRA
jgi:cysteinyl-tRNA synthetase